LGDGEMIETVLVVIALGIAASVLLALAFQVGA
jgi:hypothetical protein